MAEDNNLCGNTYTAEYSPTEPCEQVSTDCVVYQGSLPELSLGENSQLTSIINAVVSSLVTLSTTNLSQNNIPKSLYLGFYSEGTPLERTASAINNLTTPLIVSDKEIYFFSIIISNSFYVYTFNGIGKGTYGVGETPISTNNLQLISKRGLNTQSVLNQTSTDTVELGNIGVSPIQDGVNALNPPIEIQPLAQGLTVFTANINGEDLSYLYIGDSGFVGTGQTPKTASDFQLIPNNSPDSIQPATATPPITGKFLVDLSNYLSTDYTGTITNSTDLQVAPGAVQAGNARIKGNWPTKPTFTGATETNNSNFIANNDIYLYVEKWADGVIYWYTTD